jgi:hypothetical protein
MSMHHLSSQEFGDILLSHWHNLWPLPAAERIKKIDEIERDMIYQMQLGLVSQEMEEAQ